MKKMSRRLRGNEGDSLENAQHAMDVARISQAYTFACQQEQLVEDVHTHAQTLQNLLRDEVEHKALYDEVVDAEEKLYQRLLYFKVRRLDVGLSFVELAASVPTPSGEDAPEAEESSGEEGVVEAASETPLQLELIDGQEASNE